MGAHKQRTGSDIRIEKGDPAAAIKSLNLSFEFQTGLFSVSALFFSFLFFFFYSR
jgi:hypothetical protein